MGETITCDTGLAFVTRKIAIYYFIVKCVAEVNVTQYTAKVYDYVCL